MTHNTAIEWTHIPGFTGETWNPVVGCTVVSPGCKYCYAMKVAGARLDGNPKTPHYAGTTQAGKAGPVWTGKVARASERTRTAPLRDQCAAAGTPFFFKQWGEHRLSEMDESGTLTPPLRAMCFEPGKLQHWTGERFEPPAKCATTGDVFRPGAVLAGRVGKKAAGHLLDGVAHHAFPACVAATAKGADHG